MLWSSLRAYQIYGANTDVGKTILSTILSKALVRRVQQNQLLYLKPVSTGPGNEADDRHIAKFAGIGKPKCLFQFARAVSPHIAAREGGIQPPSDQSIVEQVKGVLQEHANSNGRWALVETAGGVLSPAPSGSSQADLYRPLRLPVILVGDHKLGGIATSISAYESLTLRGYDVESVVVFQDQEYGNAEYLGEYFQDRGIQSFALPLPPPRAASEAADSLAMAEYYGTSSESKKLGDLVSLLEEKHQSRLESIESSARRSDKSIWHPFTQHQTRAPEDVMTIDSAYGDFFQVNRKNQSSTPSNELLQPAFDGSASWWTQGLGHGNPELSLSAAYAAGRYGHVMFAGAVHEPALAISELLLKELGNERLQKVFFTDNGSTGMEVAVKMALRASCDRYGWDKSDDLKILGLKGSYHGDTMGVMNCSEPSAYNEKVDWHRPAGFWLDPPQVKYQRGVWVVEPPVGQEKDFGPKREFQSLDAIFDVDNREKIYDEYIKSTLLWLTRDQGIKFGALIMEPIIMGAGGMIFVDPLFQSSLARLIRSDPSLIIPDNHPSTSSTTTNSSPNTWTGLPVIADEVFTGLFRLGRMSSSSFINLKPDISVYAKLLTGGLVPLCVTLASQSIFEAFLGEQKSDALLHGHSYTAHAVGCQVAETSVRKMLDMQKNGAWDGFSKEWELAGSQPAVSSSASPSLWSMFSPTTLSTLSAHPLVESTWALGSVLAISLHDSTGNYTSSAADFLQKRLLSSSPSSQPSILATGSDSGSETPQTPWITHSRVLGNVIYFMVSQTSTIETVRALERKILEALAMGK